MYYLNDPLRNIRIKERKMKIIKRSKIIKKMTMTKVRTRK
jgi:hypothetical protein